MNVNRLLEADAAGAIRKHLPQAKGIGVYGSWLTGTNHQRSDLDIWVKAATRPPAIAAAKAQKELSQKLGTDVQLTVLDKEQLESLRTRGNPFYNSLYNSFTLWGEPID
jgi:predicted nucleotidyltransferase